MASSDDGPAAIAPAAPSQLDGPCSPANLELASHLGRALTRLIRVASRAKAEAMEGPARTDLSSFPLLAALAQTGPMRSTALAEAVLSDPSTVSRQVAYLVHRGYVERRADPADRRAALLALTERGEQALAGHCQHRDARLAHVMRAWPEDERRQLAVLIDRLADDLADHLAQSSQPPTSIPPDDRLHHTLRETS